MAYNPMPSPGRGLPALERARPELQQQRGPQMYGSARQAAVQEPLWQHDLVAWLDMELVRRRGADGGKGFTEIYEREVAYSWVLVFGTNVRQLRSGHAFARMQPSSHTHPLARAPFSEHCARLCAACRAVSISVSE